MFSTQWIATQLSLFSHSDVCGFGSNWFKVRQASRPTSNPSICYAARPSCRLRYPACWRRINCVVFQKAPVSAASQFQVGPGSGLILRSWPICIRRHGRAALSEIGHQSHSVRRFATRRAAFSRAQVFDQSTLRQPDLLVDMVSRYKRMSHRKRPSSASSTKLSAPSVGSMSWCPMLAYKRTRQLPR